MTVTAIFVDGGFFLRRHAAIYGRGLTPEQTARDLFGMCLDHLKDSEKDDLYRIFFYDCPPLSKKAHNPISKRAIDFSRTDAFKFRTEFHQQLVRLRKVALRLGRLNDRSGGWIIKPHPTKELLAGQLQLADLDAEDVGYDVKQKGVDMRLGLDITSICHKQLARRIVLVTADADFVPVAKFARREGMDVVLDPMWSQISNDLYVHIDGLKSVCPRPGGKSRRIDSAVAQ